MSGTSYEGRPDKPRNIYETMYVGMIIVGTLLAASVVTGIALAILQYLFTVLGLLLVIGVPVVLILSFVAGYAWRQVDPSDPFSLR